MTLKHYINEEKHCFSTAPLTSQIYHNCQVNCKNLLRKLPVSRFHYRSPTFLQSKKYREYYLPEGYTLSYDVLLGAFYKISTDLVRQTIKSTASRYWCDTNRCVITNQQLSSVVSVSLKYHTIAPSAKSLPAQKALLQCFASMRL
jgi:hypothetical protein